MRRRHFLHASAAASGLALAHWHKLASGQDNAKKQRVAVIGHTGRGNYGHELDVAWQQLPEVEIVAVADADATGLAAAQKRLNLTQGFADYRRMLTEVKPDLVAICPRFMDEHRDMALAAIAAGAKGIYIEKPFCRTPEEADEIVNACEKQGTKLAIAHRNRYHPVLPVLKNLLKEGLIGKLIELRGRGKEDARGGALDFWVLGSHVLNIMHYFGGDPVACSATLLQEKRLVIKTDVQEGAEGTGLLAGNELHVRYELASGVPGFFDSVAKLGQKEAGFGLQLIGTKGVIDLRMDVEPFAHFQAGNPFNPKSEAKGWTPISTAGVGQPEPIPDLGKQLMGHGLVLRDLLSSIHEKREPLCNATQGRTIVEMITAAFESHRLQGQRVTWPLANRKNPFASL